MYICMYICMYVCNLCKPSDTHWEYLTRTVGDDHQKCVGEENGESNQTRKTWTKVLDMHPDLSVWFGTFERLEGQISIPIIVT